MIQHRKRSDTRPGRLTYAVGLALLLSGGLAGCREDAPDDIIVTEQSTEALVFVKTTAEETLNRSWAEGNLFKLSPIAPDGVVTPITSFTGASISDPCVSFDGERILFSMRQQGSQWRNIWEIGADGTGLRQVTSGGGHVFWPAPTGSPFTSSNAAPMPRTARGACARVNSAKASATRARGSSTSSLNAGKSSTSCPGVSI